MKYIYLPMRKGMRKRVRISDTVASTSTSTTYTSTWKPCTLTDSEWVEYCERLKLRLKEIHLFAYA